MLASYEKNFPLKDLAPAFAEVEGARKAAEKVREAGRKARSAAEKAAGKEDMEPGEISAEALDAKPLCSWPHIGDFPASPLASDGH